MKQACICVVHMVAGKRLRLLKAIDELQSSDRVDREYGEKLTDPDFLILFFKSMDHTIVNYSPHFPGFP